MSGALRIFVCPSCNAVVKSETGYSEGLVCDECGYQFEGKAEKVAGRKVQERKVSPIPKSKKGAVGSSGGIVRDLTSRKVAPVAVAPLKSEGEKRSRRKRKDESGKVNEDVQVMADGMVRERKFRRGTKKENNKFLLYFVLGWMVVIVVAFAFYAKSKIGEPKDRDRDLASEETEEEIKGRKILKKFMPQVRQSFVDFFNESSDQGRSQFIDYSGELAFEYSDHLSRDSFRKMSMPIVLRESNVLFFGRDETGKERFGIESVWEDQDQKKVGALHFWDGKSWKLDWENFARYSTEGWGKFKARLGDRRGKFRVFVRKQLVNVVSQTRGKSIYLVFYQAPRFWEEDELYLETESPVVVVPINSDVGQKFLELWERFEQGKSEVGSILGKQLDPDGFMRVVADLEWREDRLGEWDLSLRGIEGVEWFGKRVRNYYLGKED